MRTLALYAGSLGGKSVAFDDQSSDPDGEVTAWHWEFGDGDTSTERHPAHTYAEPGTYPVKLTVTDEDGRTDAVTRNYTVLQPPAANAGPVTRTARAATTNVRFILRLRYREKAALCAALSHGLT